MKPDVTGAVLNVLNAFCAWYRGDLTSEQYGMRWRVYVNLLHALDGKDMRIAYREITRIYDGGIR